ncbi:MAG TPA: hypothetical protein VG982_01855 [Candidatus Paceibacterota bacterium]|nr:hypothetical protein [Candidatus Paceibacterota bacterium]
MKIIKDNISLSGLLMAVLFIFLFGLQINPSDATDDYFDNTPLKKVSRGKIKDDSDTLNVPLQKVVEKR